MKASHLSSLLLRWLVCLALLPGVLFSQTRKDECPIPRVEIRNYREGKPYRPPGFLDFEQGTPGEQFVASVHDFALNRIINDNRDDVLFLESVVNSSSALDPDFFLTLDGKAVQSDSGRWDCTTRADLVDRTGKVVIRPQVIRYSNEDDMARVAERIAAMYRYLLRTIRRHQVQVREETGSAIYALLEFEPAEAEIAQGEALELELTLFDCGPDERVPLPDRDVELDLAGVGDLDRYKVTTDEEGKATVKFKSEDEGLAEVTAWWVYENTEGRRLSAGNTATIRVGPLPELKIDIAPTQAEGKKYFLGIVEALAEDHILKYIRVDGRPLRKSDWPPTDCAHAKRWKAGGIRIDKGEQRRFEEVAKAGPQESRIRIEVHQPDFQTATVQALVYAHAEPEAGWDEEDGSNIYTHAVFDVLINVENPSETDYDLIVRCPHLGFDCEGAVEYEIELFGRGFGCRQGTLQSIRSLAGLRYAWYEPEEADLPAPTTPRPMMRVRVREETHAQFELRVNMRTEAYGGVLEPPYSGTCPLELKLEIEAVPLEKEEEPVGK